MPNYPTILLEVLGLPPKQQIFILLILGCELIGESSDVYMNMNPPASDIVSKLDTLNEMELEKLANIVATKHKNILSFFEKAKVDKAHARYQQLVSGTLLKITQKIHLCCYNSYLRTGCNAFSFSEIADKLLGDAQITESVNSKIRNMFPTKCKEALIELDDESTKEGYEEKFKLTELGKKSARNILGLD